MRNCPTIVLAVTLLLLPSTLLAQTYTAEEQSVVDAVKRCNQALADSDAATWNSCFADDYVGWQYNMPATRDAEAGRWAIQNPARRPLVAFSVQPLRVRVLGDIAIIHYYYYSANENADGSLDYGRARWTDVMLREGGTWVWIADHGGADPNSGP
jgi:ketosteroid isomerase-like protein